MTDTAATEAGRPPVTVWREMLAASDEDADTKHVGLTISLHMNSLGQGATMGLLTLIDETSRSRSAVKRGLVALRKRWLHTTPGGGRGNTNRYDIRPAVIEGVAGSPLKRVQKPVQERVQKGVQEEVHQEPVSGKGVQTALETGPDRITNGSTQDPELGTTNKTTKNETTAPPQRRDEIWEALMEVCEIDTNAIPKSARGAYNVAASTLRGLRPVPTADEIRRRSAEMARKWGPDTLTPTAIARRWAEIEPRATPHPATRTGNVQNTVEGVASWLERTTS